MTSSLSFIRHCTKNYHPLSQLAVSTIFVLFGRATRATAAFVPSTPFSPAVAGHPCFLWRRKASSETLKMVPTPESSVMTILESPSAERNKVPIYNMLEAMVFPPLIDNNMNDSRSKIHVLELAAGCGVHTTHFVSSFLSTNKSMGMEWHPSDPDAEARPSIDARVQRAELEDSVVPANAWILGKSGGTACGDCGNRDKGDAGASQSGNGGDEADYEQHHDFFDLVLCINMIHIAPYEATKGLMECAGKVLRKGGMLVCYGPYKVGGTAVESNLNFDKALRSRNPEWGVRNLEDVMEVAKTQGLEFEQSIEMPANNLIVLFRKT
mmetsp:Transcript_39619/g.72540  ORF Transcript_39619/g.72540 Transcript_39619/m.72540 type:complete len:324 (-) Transcript_39619:937-1908(-)